MYKERRLRKRKRITLASDNIISVAYKILILVFFVAFMVFTFLEINSFNSYFTSQTQSEVIDINL